MVELQCPPLLLRGLPAVLLITSVLSWGCGRDGPAQPSPALFGLTGNVRNNFAVALAGATVFIVDGPNQGRSATTDRSGRYRFTGLRQSGFTVQASAPGHLSQAQGVTLTSDQTVDFVLVAQPLEVTLSGLVTDTASAKPIAGAVVSINGRYRGPTDASGRFNVTGLLDAGRGDYTYVSAANYTPDYRYILGTTQNVRLYRTERIVAGESRLVTVEPDDTLCVNNLEDTPADAAYVCRSLNVLAPADGVMTLEAVSLSDGTHPPLEVEIGSNVVDWSKRNPLSFPVAAGTEVLVHVEMPVTAAARDTFTIVTSLSPP